MRRGPGALAAACILAVAALVVVPGSVQSQTTPPASTRVCSVPWFLGMLRYSNDGPEGTRCNPGETPILIPEGVAPPAPSGPHGRVIELAGTDIVAAVHRFPPVDTSDCKYIQPFARGFLNQLNDPANATTFTYVPGLDEAVGYSGAAKLRVLQGEPGTALSFSAAPWPAPPENSDNWSGPPGPQTALEIKAGSGDATWPMTIERAWLYCIPYEG